MAEESKSGHSPGGRLLFLALCIAISFSCQMPASSGSGDPNWELLAFIIPVDERLDVVLKQTDRGDGSYELITNLGSYLWAKCPQDNSASGNTYGGGGASDTCTTGTVGTFIFCPATDNTCNGGVDDGFLNDPGSTNTSAVFTSCDGLTLASRSDWRVPTVIELGTFLFRAYETNPASFPNNGPDRYWSRESFNATNARMADFNNSSTGNESKANPNRLRCVADL